MSLNENGSLECKAPGFVRLLLVIAIILTPVTVAAQQLTIFRNGLSEDVTIALGTSLTVSAPAPIERLIVGDPAIADAVPLTDTSFHLTGMSLGRTNVTVFGATGLPQGVVSVEVSADTANLEATLREAIPNSNIKVSSVNGRLQLTGTTVDAVGAARAVQIAEQYGSDTVINAIRVTSPQQVMLEVRFVEARRNSGQELGVSWFSSGQNIAFSTGAATAGGVSLGADLPSGADPFGSLISQVLDFGIDADILIQALEQQGMARRLAEPNLVALSGEQASFLAGGEVPVPDVDGSFVHKPYGVLLSFTPTVLDNGLINLRLEPEVSEIDFSNTVAGVPSFTTRRVTTTVELRDGQSFAVAGLLQTSHVRTQSQIPLLGDLPVIGALFRSSAFQKQETDLVVIVTARLAQPATPGVPLRTPLDGTAATSAVEFFLMGNQEATTTQIEGYARGRGVIGPFGHIIEFEP
ncbi:type II and III secretion system protein family protein [Pelagibacterium sp. H642]|uniref:type II and III secretion system protein family protein n=1 Tax=Pelagibacterium sp. H642 TaxID=1881069 RepID=UPI002815454D|nr:type II and III secretion system protein family protein [Pelagibacterium sp. H642]WMT92863.1 type II and III secretion system protein family protein [Pelagibacterium sp. H642]